MSRCLLRSHDHWRATCTGFHYRVATSRDFSPLFSVDTFRLPRWDLFNQLGSHVYNSVVEIVVKLPDDLAQHPDPGREALEALVIQGYRAGSLSHYQASQLLGILSIGRHRIGLRLGSGVASLDIY